MAVILDGGRLTLTGYVGDDLFGDGFTHGDVVIALAQVEDDSDLTVYINSGGGIATEGSAIHALLSRRAGRTDVVVDGVAASAASLIMMVGDTVTMSAGSVLMVHDPAAFTFGNSDDHSKSIEALEALSTSYGRVYAGKTGKSADECRAIMKAERWYSPDEAVAEGFADQTSETKAAPVAAFAYGAYAHAPKRLVALAAKKNWRLPDAKTKAVMSAASPGQPEEKSMTDKERADQLAAENVTLKADLATANAAKEADAKKATASAAEIVDICATAGVPTMAASLIREGLSVDDAKARASNAKDVRAAVDLARKSCPTIEANAADTFIASGLSMDQVRSKLFETITAAQSPEISGVHQAAGGNDDPEAVAAKIVAIHRDGQKKRSA